MNMESNTKNYKYASHVTKTSYSNHKNIYIQHIKSITTTRGSTPRGGASRRPRFGVSPGGLCEKPVICMHPSYQSQLPTMTINSLQPG